MHFPDKEWQQHKIPELKSYWNNYIKPELITLCGCPRDFTCVKQSLRIMSVGILKIPAYAVYYQAYYA